LEPTFRSDPGVRATQEVAFNSSNLSWANVAASVIRPPKELFLVVCTIKPAKAKKVTDKMTKAIRISINEKPFDFMELFNLLALLKMCLFYIKQNLYQEIFKFEILMGKERRVKLLNEFNML
jgi:hypothetical protein